MTVSSVLTATTKIITRDVDFILVEAVVGRPGPKGDPGDSSPAGLPPIILPDAAWAVVDTLVTSNATWKIQVDDLVVGARVAYFVSSTHNGVGDSEPTDVQWSVFGKSRFGSLGVGTHLQLREEDQALQLCVQGSAGFKVSVWRLQGLG